MAGLLNLVQTAQAFLAVPNVTAHPSTASVGLPITVLLYNGPLLYGFNVPIKGLRWNASTRFGKDVIRCYLKSAVMYTFVDKL